jgi:hypothetical protein
MGLATNNALTIHQDGGDGLTSVATLATVLGVFVFRVVGFMQMIGLTRTLLPILRSSIS